MATTKRAPITDAAIDRESLSMKEILAAQPQHDVYIAPDKNDPMFRCTINGYSLQFPRGTVTKVPESVLLLINQSNTVASEVLANEARFANIPL